MKGTFRAPDIAGLQLTSSIHEEKILFTRLENWHHLDGLFLGVYFIILFY